MNKESMMETTTKFRKLKDEFDSDYYKPSNDWDSSNDIKIYALKRAMDEVLDLLDELVRS